MLALASLAVPSTKAAKERGIAAQIVGIEANAASAEWALANGLIDRVTNFVPEQADLIALCVPGDLVADWVVKLAGSPSSNSMSASVKGPIVEAIAARQSIPGQFIPCHPISGSEKSGPQAADATLFDSRTVVIMRLNIRPVKANEDAAQNFLAGPWSLCRAHESAGP